MESDSPFDEAHAADIFPGASLEASVGDEHSTHDQYMKRQIHAEIHRKS